MSKAALSPLPPALGASFMKAKLVDIQSDGRLLVVDGDAALHSCECLESVSAVPLAPGDALLVASTGDLRIVVGKVGHYLGPQPPATLALQATENLSLQCGASSIDLRADGKVMIRGEDVLVRAKGTKRIRAGTVAIN